MTKRLLTDAELRAAAAARPGYATYPEYRPGQQERLAQLPLRVEVDQTRNTIDAGPASPVRPGRIAGDMWSSPCRQWPVGPTPIAAAPALPTPALDARPPAPAAAPVADTVAELPEKPVFDFQPRRIEERPWWRRRWHWGVIASGTRTRHGYTWTEAGARRRTARAARRAAR